MFSFNGLQRYEEFSEYNEIQPENLIFFSKLRKSLQGKPGLLQSDVTFSAR